MLLEKIIQREAVSPAAFADAAPAVEIREGRYLLRFARSEADLDAVLKLRFEVFNLELGEGLVSSFQTGRDQDEFDLTCHHLMVFDEESHQVVGTYRVQTGAMAARSHGFYSAGEFNLSQLPLSVLNDSIELGRACIAQEHRHTQVLFLLWKGIAAYLRHQRKRYLFGCCSLTSQDAREGQAVMQQLAEEGSLHPNFTVLPQPGFECETGSLNDEELPDAKIPKLFRTYLKIGAKVCGVPAIDRQFKTIDFFVLMDIHELSAFSRRMFFGR